MSHTPTLTELKAQLEEAGLTPKVTKLTSATKYNRKMMLRNNKSCN